MEEGIFFKVVCVDESDPMEYKILEDVNRKNLNEVHDFVQQKINKHIGAKWLLLPCSYKVN